MSKRRTKKKPVEDALQSADFQRLANEQSLSLALQHHNSGEFAPANDLYRNILETDPDHPVALHMAGVVAIQVGQLAIAGRLIQKAIAAKPDYFEAHFSLGNLCLTAGQWNAAFACFRRAITLNPKNDSYWDGLLRCLELMEFEAVAVDDTLSQDLLNAINRPTTNPALVIRAFVSALRAHPDFLKVLEETSSLGPEDNVDYWGKAERLSALPLLLRIMELSPIQFLDVERMLTTLRRGMIQEVLAGNWREIGRPFSAALALHCYVNEYIFPETDEEQAAVERLQQMVAALVEAGQEVSPALLIALAAYKPLYRFAWASGLLNREWDDSTRVVVERQVAGPLKERSLRDHIPRLTSIENTVSKAVRQQYEENPFPCWTNAGLAREPKAIENILKNFDLGDYESPEHPEILIAGCGTGQQTVVTASSVKNARILSVDLSLSSLSYALRKTQELGLSNVEYGQADIMELGSLERQFDVVYCGGVLHHLADPLAGWRVLLDLLRPGGLMNIGLYSEIARQDIVKVRSLIADRGYSTSPEDIRQFRQDIVGMGEDSGIATVIHSRDFFSLSECRDLLFHVQEHRFTLPQIEATLKEFGLEFLGFTLRHPSSDKRFKQINPQDSASKSLGLWHQFELEYPHTFRGMYQFWCRKTSVAS